MKSISSTVKFGTLGLIASSVLISPNLAAHHGVGGQFDTSKELQITGVMTNIRFVNPHSYIYFDETGVDGTVNSWQCELLAGVNLKRRGWTDEMFSPGTQVTVDGSPAWSGDNVCYVHTITFADGRMLEREGESTQATTVVGPRALTLNGKPNLSGSWIKDPDGPSDDPRRAAGGMGPGGAGGMVPGGNGAMGGEDAALPFSTNYDMTEANKIASAGFKRDDNPRYNCKATNIFRDWTFDQRGQNVNGIEQSDDLIVISYGFMEIVREIHMDMDSHPDNITPSISGHSIGYWDDDVLVVDTVGFAEGYLDAGPRAVAMHSDQLHVTERFSLNEDGSRLKREWELEDPVYLNSKSTGEDEVIVSNIAFVPYNCQDISPDAPGTSPTAVSQNAGLPNSTKMNSNDSGFSKLWLLALAVLALIGGFGLYARKKG